MMTTRFVRGNRGSMIRKRILPVFAVLVLILLAGTARCETGAAILNASGNLNVEPSVDPIDRGEGYSAVLYNSKNGLPSSEANAIAQDSIGLIWIGGYAGLTRYDGNKFEQFAPGAGISSVRCLYTDSQDRLWIGSNDSGVFLMENGEIRHWSESDGLRSLSIRDIAEAEDGRIYIASAIGAGFIDASFTYTPVEDERVSGQTINHVRRGSDGRIYGVASSGDLFAMQDGKVVSFLSVSDFPQEKPRVLLPDPERPGFLYAGTEHYVCYGSLEEGFVSREIAPLSDAQALEYIGGRVWICARNGIGRLEDDGVHLMGNTPMNESFNHIMTDMDGNLWATSSHQGVMKIVPNRFTDVFEQYGLPPEVVNSTCIYDGLLFTGTETGLIVLKDGEKLESLPVTEAVTASGTPVDTDDLLAFLDGIRIRTMLRDSRNRLWICTAREKGLLRYDHGTITQFTREDGILDESVRVVCECEDGSVLVGTNAGINVIEGDRVVKGYGRQDGLDVGMILTVTEGFHHELIAGSDGGGVYVITPEGTKRIGLSEGLPSEIVMRVKRSRAGDCYWIITGNALVRMTPGYQVETIREFPGANNIDLYENSSGDMWLLGTTGINVILARNILENRSADPVFFGTANGLPCVVTSNSSSELTEDGDLYMAGSEGVVKVNIDEALEYFEGIRISVPYVDADDKRYYPDENGDFFVPGYTRKLTVYPYLLNYSLYNPRISYHLEGFDEEYVTVSRNELTQVYYTNLAKGTYRFMIRVTDPVEQAIVEIAFPIIKGKASSFGNDGSIIMDLTSLFFMGGLLIYTSLYRKRGKLDDRLFFIMIITNMVLAVFDVQNYLADGSGFADARFALIIGNILFYAAFEIFPYLYMLYLDYRVYQDKARLRKIKIWFGIPCLAILLLLPASIVTGWIFSVNADALYQSGPLNNLVFVPAAFYFVCSLFLVRKINIRLVFLGILLIVTRVVLGIWFRDISSTALIYTLFLVCTHIHVMNSPLNEEML